MTKTKAITKKEKRVYLQLHGWVRLPKGIMKGEYWTNPENLSVQWFYLEDAYIVLRMDQGFLSVKDIVRMVRNGEKD